MKICPNCGGNSKETDAFCKSCGFVYPVQTPIMVMSTPRQDVPPQEAPFAPPPVMPQQKKKKRLWIIPVCVAAVALLVVGGILIARAFGSKARSTDSFVSAQRDYLLSEDGYFRLNNLFSFSSDITISAKLNTASEEGQRFNKVLDGSSIVIKTEYTGARLLLDMLLNIRGSNILEGMLTLTDKQIGFSVPALDEAYYVMDTQALAKMIYLDAGTLFGAAHTFAEYVQTRVVDERLSYYTDALQAGLAEKAFTVEENKRLSLQLLGEETTATLITWQPGAQEMKQLVDSVCNALEQDTALAQAVGHLMQVAGRGQEDVLRTLCTQMRQGADRITDDNFHKGDFVWSLARDGSGRVNMISIKIGEEEIRVESLTKGNEVTRDFALLQNGVAQNRTLDRYTEEGSIRKGVITEFTYAGKIEVAYEIDTKRQSQLGLSYGSYTPDLSNVIPGMSLQLTVSEAAEGGTDHRITVTGLSSLSGGFADGGELLIHTSPSSTATEPSGVRTDISSYDMSQISGLFRGMVNQLSYVVMTTPALWELAIDFLQ